MTHAEPSKTSIRSHTFRSSRWIWIMLLAMIVIGTVGGVYKSSKRAKAQPSRDEPRSSEGASEPEESLAVTATQIASGGILRASTRIGTVQPYEEADLYAKVSGYLSKLHVDYGDRVKKGQLLVELDDPEVLKDAERAEADLHQAQAAVVQTEAALESAKADREALSSAVEQAEAEVERYVSMRAYHEKKLARYQDLVQKQAIPQQLADEEEESLDSTKASVSVARKAILNAKAQLLAAVARVKKAEADILEAKANVEVAQAKLDRANVFVSYTKILAPYDGVITKRNFFPGAFIRSASEGGLIPLLTVARTNKVRVVTQVPDSDVPFTDVGDDAEISLDALPGKIFKAKVSRFAETEDPTSRTMHTEIDIDNPDNLIRAGMYGTAKIILDRPLKSSTLPSTCLAGESKGGKADVYVIKDGKAKKTRVEIGADDGIRVEITSGLGEKDRVILNPQSVTDGIAVREITEQPREPSSARDTSSKSSQDHP